MAQIVSLETLKKLAAKPVAEAEKPCSHFFWEFNDRFIDEIDSIHRKTSTLNRSSMIEHAYAKMKDGFLRDNCPPVEYISEGSARAAYALDGGLCLKAAMSKRGGGQNRAEAENLARADGFDIFPRLYDAGDEDMAILVECVSPCSKSYRTASKEFYHCLGCSPFTGWSSPAELISSQLELVAKCAEDGWTFDEAMEEVCSRRTDDKGWQRTADMVLSPMNPAQRILSKLYKYVADNSSQIDPSDFVSLDNQGFAIREGQVVPIVLDAGFSPEVRDEYY